MGLQNGPFQEAQRAAAMPRALALLRLFEHGMSVRELAAVHHLSRQRISQLIKKAREAKEHRLTSHAS